MKRWKIFRMINLVFYTQSVLNPLHYQLQEMKSIDQLIDHQL